MREHTQDIKEKRKMETGPKRKRNKNINQRDG